MPTQDDDDGRRSYAYFGVRGDFDPAALAFEMGLIPSRCVRKHSRDPGRRVPRSSILRFAEAVSPANDRGAADVYDLADMVVAGLDGRSGPIAAALRGRGSRERVERPPPGRSGLAAAARRAVTRPAAAGPGLGPP